MSTWARTPPRLDQAGRDERMETVARLEHRPPKEISLEVEHAWVTEALQHAHDAIEGVHRSALRVAREHWPDEWTRLEPRLVTLASWVGYDQERPLGESEEGAKTALPIWMSFMREALRGVPERHRAMPDGIIQLRISPDTGMLASAENHEAISEIFMVDHLPTGGTPGEEGTTPASVEGSASAEPIF